MSRILVRVGASLAVSVALVGGGLGFGVGSASAESSVGSVVGFVPEAVAPVLLATGLATGSIDSDDVWFGCNTASCPTPVPTPLQNLLRTLGVHGENGPWPALPWAPEPVFPTWER
jgi:hypothetical protein